MCVRVCVCVCAYVCVCVCVCVCVWRVLREDFELLPASSRDLYINRGCLYPLTTSEMRVCMCVCTCVYPLTTSEMCVCVCVYPLTTYRETASASDLAFGRDFRGGSSPDALPTLPSVLSSGMTTFTHARSKKGK